jgi:hypothetical protein
MTSVTLPWQKRSINWLFKTMWGRVVAVSWISLWLIGMLWGLSSMPMRAPSYHKFLHVEFDALKNECEGELSLVSSSAKFGSSAIHGTLDQSKSNLTSKQRVDFCIGIAVKRGWNLLSKDIENAFLCKEGVSLAFGIARPYSEWKTDVFLNLSSRSWQHCGEKYPTTQ